MLDYFAKGFHLTNSAYKFVFFTLMFYLVGTFSIEFSESTWGIFTTIISLISFVLSMAVYLMAPLILEKQQKENLSLTQIYSIFKSNLRRYWKGGTVSFLLFMLMIMIAAIILAFMPDTEWEKLFVEPSVSTFLFYLIISIPAAFTLFVPMFYALQKQSVITSIVSSAKFCLKHSQFFFMIVLFYFAYLIPSVILTSDNIVIRILNLIFTTYFGTVAMATALIYYQKHS